MIGIALWMLLLTIITRPLRRAHQTPETLIAGWIAQLRAEQNAPAAPSCPHCGQPRRTDERFCRSCGQYLTKEVLDDDA